MQHVFIIGSKGIPGNYGGYETFVDKLTEYHKDCKELKYHVACKAKNSNEFEYHNAHCFNINVPDFGPAQAIFYDVAALKYSCNYIEKHRINHPIIYILACRIGPIASHYQRKIHKLGGKVFVNPDGHEWLRAKWSTPVRKYWKISEQLMVKHSDLLICDSKNIEKYIHKTYVHYHPKTTYISYGAETRKSTLSNDDPMLLKWYKEKGISSKSYYLVVGRFVPENNYETMIREFMMSESMHDFVLITNVNNKFYEQLKQRTGFDKDNRIKFVGTVYNQELLMKIREHAYGYLHGHEVGGTNPSLLEALFSTDLNLLLDVGFNREVAEDGALYWKLDYGNLAELIEVADRMYNEEIYALGLKAKRQIMERYPWDKIVKCYKKTLLNGGEYENTSNS